MKIKINHLVAMMSVIMTYTFTACSQSEPEVIQGPTIYDGCCGTEPWTYEYKEYKVFIPNVITPNGDGINDVFYPRCNIMKKGKFAVGNIKIYNDTSKIVWVLSGLDIEKADEWGFKGVANKKPFKPEVWLNYDYTGKFKYTLHLAFSNGDGTEHVIEIEGEACVVRCDEDAHALKDKEGCHFPNQGLLGVYDPTLPSNEENCIK